MNEKRYNFPLSNKISKQLQAIILLKQNKNFKEHGMRMTVRIMRRIKDRDEPFKIEKNGQGK